MSNQPSGRYPNRPKWTDSPPEDDIAAAGRFASNVSHEVNNPLTVIMMGVSFLLDDVPNNSPLRKDILSIKTEAERIRTLLRTLSDYAHTDLGDRILLDFNAAIRDALKIVAPRMRRQSIICLRRFSHLSVVASADPVRFGQALARVLENALDAMPGGGCLKVSTCRHNGLAVVQIEDTGKGIQLNHLPHIFEPMYSTSSTAGMGLAFVRRIIKLHGGSLTVESAPGQGSVFTVSMPLAVPANTPKSK